MGAGTPKGNHQAGGAGPKARFALRVPNPDCLGIIRA